jgi:4-hydroxythreonine-4-phosphate dehydrogenase
MIRAVFTCGDVNGIGSEITVKAFEQIFLRKNDNQILFICPKNVFEFYYKQTKARFKFQFVNNSKDFSNSCLNIISLPKSKLNFGKVTSHSGSTAYHSILTAIDLIKKDLADVLITAPISKEAINKSVISFTGHTELLAASEKCDNYLMMFLSEKIKAALLTIHKPIKEVPGSITANKLISGIKLLDSALNIDFGIANPKIAVLGLNPHAGENGLIGKEELKIIKPTIKKLEHKYLVKGPFVPDAFWGNKTYNDYDITLGMYHDQVLIPFKLLHFNSGVNFTAGLKLIRTSPDHGTAFDIAGKNIADPSSILQSYKYAIKIFRNRKKYFASIGKY